MSGRLAHGPLDRALHRLAFASWPLQTALADIEEIAFKAQLAGLSVERPVFVAGLPRAGTTLILEMIEQAGGFASYRYSDMPFLLAPMLWRAMTRGAARDRGGTKRAHGDGMAVGLDSPEAFEEVVWRTHHPERYRGAAIEPWPAGVDPEFEGFFRLQMRKIIALRGEGRPLRYLSKNNGNIARLDAVLRMFPDAVVIVPYRDPVDQARSLLRQHLSFIALHDADPFARQYMLGIGHYDFGRNLKPIDFGGWLGASGGADFTELDAWLDYWCAAYGHLAGRAENQIHFVSYDRLRAEPGAELALLEQALGLDAPGALTAQAGRVRPSPERPGGHAPRSARDVLRRIEARRAPAPTAARRAS
jgi:hypothetical protein